MTKPGRPRMPGFPVARRRLSSRRRHPCEPDGAAAPRPAHAPAASARPDCPSRAATGASRRRSALGEPLDRVDQSAPLQLDQRIVGGERMLVVRMDEHGAIGIVTHLAAEADPPGSDHLQVVAVVDQPLDLLDPREARERVDRRVPERLAFPAGLEQGEHERAVGRQHVAHHRPVAQLEHVERKRSMREQHHVRQREHRDRLRQIGRHREPSRGPDPGSVRWLSPRRRTRAARRCGRRP